jgi:hypothetical protein
MVMPINKVNLPIDSIFLRCLSVSPFRAALVKKFKAIIRSYNTKTNLTKNKGIENNISQ